MLARLRDNWVYGGALMAVLLLCLTPVLSAGWPLALVLIWLQLPAYMLHQYEEHDGDRFRLFVNTTIGGGRDVLTRLDTFVINIVGVWGVNGAAFAWASTVHLGYGLVAVYLSLVNAVGHCVPAILLRRYNPGLGTSVLLFMPLGALALFVLKDHPEVTGIDHLRGLAVSFAIHAAIMARVFLRRRSLARADSAGLD